MDKAQTLDLIDKIKTAHEQQMYKLELLLSGKEVEDITVLSKTECEFGKLLQKNEDLLRKIVGSLFYEQMDSTHAKWHEEYYKVFEIVKKYVGKTKKGFFSKLTNSKKLHGMELDKAKFYYSDLKLITNELLNTIDISKRRIAALAETKFE